VTSDDAVARLEAERLRPMPPEPTWLDDLQQLIHILARLLLEDRGQ